MAVQMSRSRLVSLAGTGRPLPPVGMVADLGHRALRLDEGPRAGPADDTTTILLRFESGIAGTIFCSVATGTNFNFSVYGTKGLAEITGARLQSFRFVPTDDKPPAGVIVAPPAETIEHGPFDMLAAELSEFARCIHERVPYPVSTEDVLHGMAVFDAIVRSAASGRAVAVT